MLVLGTSKFQLWQPRIGSQLVPVASVSSRLRLLEGSLGVFMNPWRSLSKQMLTYLYLVFFSLKSLHSTRRLTHSFGCRHHVRLEFHHAISRVMLDFGPSEANRDGK